MKPASPAPTITLKMALLGCDPEPLPAGRARILPYPELSLSAYAERTPDSCWITTWNRPRAHALRAACAPATGELRRRPVDHGWLLAEGEPQVRDCVIGQPIS